MATESPMRMVETSQAIEWLSSKDASAFGSPFRKKTEEFRLFSKGQKLNQDTAEFIPNRIGSAPPCMEGSAAAVENLVAVKDFTLNSNYYNSSGNVLENHKSERQGPFDPSYVAHRSSNLPPLHPRNQTDSCKENQGNSSSDNGSLVSPSTHIEEPEKQVSLDEASQKLIHDSSILKPGQNTSLLSSRRKSLVDLIQEDFPHTPSRAVGKGALNSDSCDFISDENPLETVTNLHHSVGTKSPSEDRACNNDAVLKDDTSSYEFVHIEKKNVRAPNEESRRHKQEQYYSRKNKLNQSFAHSYAYQIPDAGVPQVIPQGIQPSMSSQGITGSLYASPTTFITPGEPFYPNFQSSGLFSPQYGASSSILPPYMAGYSSQGTTLSLPFEVAYGQNLNGQLPAAVSSGEKVPHMGDFQNQSTFYGQHGLALQPPYVDPLNMQYYPHSFQQNELLSGNVNGGQFSSLVSQQNSAASAHLDGTKFQSLINRDLTIPSVGNAGISGGSYFGNSSSMGVMMQFHDLSLGSPILPSSPIAGTESNSLGGQNEMNLPQVSHGKTGFCSGQRKIRSFDDPRKQSFIEELKSMNSENYGLSDIAERLVEFSIDQHGSRFIQQKLESCSAEERESAFKEILPHASKLMTDVFGNYVIQKFFELGSPDQQKKLAEQLSGHMLPLSLQMYGCRVVQKVLEVIELDQKTQLVQELDGHVMRCVYDQNGNHVIQKCIECIPMDKIQFIISAFRGQVSTLSTHPYGCRVIQRVLEHCPDDQYIQFIVDEILESASVLAQDQYGNYVTQHVLGRGRPHERSQIISKISGKIIQLSQHKYASNVIEKCWEMSNEIERDALIEEIVSQPSESRNLLTMMKDQYANYVVQKILETSNHNHREILMSHIRVHLPALKKYTYGKHIAARFEEIADPGNDAEVP